VTIARSIAAALQAAHERGIVHRDLKPENIILAANGVKVLDFGLAQFDVAAQDLASVTRLTDAGVMAGTPPYMAPEQLLGKPTCAQTDQFAFGVVLYELLTGRHPFGRGALPTTIAKVLSEDPDRGDIDDALWAVIHRAIQKNPADRFTATRDLVAALAGVFPEAHSVARQAASPSASDLLAGTDQHTGHATMGWWMTHQLVVALGYWFMVYPTWHVHKWTGRYGVLTFLATLAVVIVGANVRLHLWFTARTYPSELASQLANINRLVRGADVAFSLMMIGIGLVIADAHTGWAALFVSFGLGAGLAFLVIEPTTARAAFRTQSEIRHLGSEI
jgi:hypothetical protein